MNEKWEEIKGYNGLYLVSNTGKVKSMEWNRTKKAKELKQYDQRGYKLVGIRRNGTLHNYLVHRLVATAFVPNPRNLYDVNHIDGNKANNCAENLEWVTKSENTRHAIKMGLRPAGCTYEHKKGNDSPVCKKILQYTKDLEFIRCWNSVYEIENELGYRKQSIHRCCRGERKTYMGYIWKHK